MEEISKTVLETVQRINNEVKDMTNAKKIKLYLKECENKFLTKQDREVVFVDWLMCNCELAEDNSLWKYDGEDYSLDGIFNVYKESIE